MLTNYRLLTSLCSYTECVRKTWGEIWPESHWRLWTFCFGRLRRHKDVSDAESNFIKVHTIHQYTIFFFQYIHVYGARVAQWWEHSPPTNVARVQIPASTPYVGWVCCWFSPLLQKVFSPGTPVFPSPHKPTIPNSNSIWNARTRVNEFRLMNS